MRRTILLALVCVLSIGCPLSHAGELRLSVRADWMLTLRAGLEYRFNRYLGIQGSIGTNTLVVAADLAAVVYAFPGTSAWQLNLLVGIPNAAVPVSLDGGFVSFGGSLQASYRLPNALGIDFRIGEGFPLFFEGDSDTIRDVDFPFGLWPDLGLGVSFPL